MISSLSAVRGALLGNNRGRRFIGECLLVSTIGLTACAQVEEKASDDPFNSCMVDAGTWSPYSPDEALAAKLLSLSDADGGRVDSALGARSDERAERWFIRGEDQISVCRYLKAVDACYADSRRVELTRNGDGWSAGPTLSVVCVGDHRRR